MLNFGWVFVFGVGVCCKGKSGSPGTSTPTGAKEEQREKSGSPTTSTPTDAKEEQREENGGRRVRGGGAVLFL